MVQMYSEAKATAYLTPFVKPPRTRASKSSYRQWKERRCILCRGAKLLCGKARCPVLVRFYAKSHIEPLIDRLDISGSSPPSVFIGRFGYPNVSIGPLIPATHGDTSMLDIPELWSGKSIDEIVRFRAMLVRGKHRVNVQTFGGRLVEDTQLLALANAPLDVDALFTKKPVGRLTLDDSVQPYGPSAPLKKMALGNVKIDHRIEKSWYDTDLKARDAVLDLYDDSVRVSKIQRAFSVGAFGVERSRRFVPTRWSITAVDSIISRHMRELVKRFPLIDRYKVFESVSLDNVFIVLMLPYAWSYELIEAWYPGTTWNPTGRRPVLFASSEGYKGRKTYADIGGCYYAARLAVTEYLRRERRLASTVILREARPGYIMPVGVWNVRENVRHALRGKPRIFPDLRTALSHISTRLDIDMKTWIAWSKLLKDLMYQRRIEDYAHKRDIL